MLLPPMRHHSFIGILAIGSQSFQLLKRQLKILSAQSRHLLHGLFVEADGMPEGSKDVIAQVLQSMDTVFLSYAFRERLQSSNACY